ncbi:SAM hydrolase/SAM-dependent halogenase family protein [Gloeobacter morelensis]|uniref:SAM-dependent chlorinase/fluorinase n=1 Tax=Gloeobacter morelensis MG652769 TaxID=2781736 RepID=A0ABY3PMS7_9CYAN|nr:SAM-dependent chlorinase/fluorinase [Gloeobacter morelensis]UFP94702.1 SAM-dependent chlorinase/fluorinase [Gloeobacter morelensis MG652769]
MPVITLLSDYGLENSTVGTIKGMLLKLCPQATLIDLTHQIRPQDLLSGRFELMTAYRSFPESTVHLAIVDPGAAMGQRAVAFRTAAYSFVGPDNGLFDGVLDIEPALEAVELSLPTSSSGRLFRGRDVFAPAAAALALDKPLAHLGRAIDPQSLARFEVDLANRRADSIHGQIQKVDHFGNLVTNIPGEWVVEQPWEIRIGGHRFNFSIDSCEIAAGKLQAQIASHGFVQLMFEGGDCARRLGVGVGQLVVMQPQLRVAR